MLHDRLVLDLTRHLPGPYATQLLGDLGARVIKVEAPPGGDPTRAVPPYDASGVSAAFRALNQGKRSLGLDLKRPEARDLILRLCARADVVVEGFRPGVMARLGLDPQELMRAHPHLVVCSISGYGQDGPYRDRAGHDLNYQAYAGALWVSTDREGRAITPGLQLGDLSAALAASVGVLAALLERERTGRGRWVDAAMLDALVSLQALHLGPHLAGQPTLPGRLPLSGGLPSYGLYRCADGRHVALGALEPKFFQGFCAAVGRPEWAERQFDPGLEAELAALFATRPRDEWRFILEDADCCLAPALDYDEVRQDPQVQARGLLGADRVAPPVRFQPPLAPPAGRPFPTRVGEHTREVLRDELGLGAAEVEGLLAAGVAHAAG